jgi:hypothetical protein
MPASCLHGVTAQVVVRLHQEPAAVRSVLPMLLTSSDHAGFGEDYSPTPASSGLVTDCMKYSPSPSISVKFCQCCKFLHWLVITIWVLLSLVGFDLVQGAPSPCEPELPCKLSLEHRLFFFFSSLLGWL